MLLPAKSKGTDCTDDSEILKAIFHGKWTFRVLRELVRGPIRLGELKRAIPECSKKVLIDTLHGLGTTRLIQRVEYPTTVEKVEYQLTPHYAEEVRRLVLGVANKRS